MAAEHGRQHLPGAPASRPDRSAQAPRPQTAGHGCRWSPADRSDRTRVGRGSQGIGMRRQFFACQLRPRMRSAGWVAGQRPDSNAGSFSVWHIANRQFSAHDRRVRAVAASNGGEGEKQGEHAGYDHPWQQRKYSHTKTIRIWFQIHCMSQLFIYICFLYRSDRDSFTKRGGKK